MAKGGDYENKKAKEISLWWTQDLEKPRKDIFYRTHGSGSRFTNAQKKNECVLNAAGDICAMDPIGFPLLQYFHFEMKKGYTGRRKFSAKKIEKGFQDILEKNPPDVLGAIIKQVNYLMASQERSSLSEFIDRKSGSPLLYNWWKKGEGERKKSERRCTIIVFEKDLRHSCIFMKESCLFKLEKVQNSIPYETENLALIRFKQIDFICTRLDHFLAWLKPSTILKIVEEK